MRTQPKLMRRREISAVIKFCGFRLSDKWDGVSEDVPVFDNRHDLVGVGYDT